jgi:Sap, sulfolipid-1-addressing protein
VQLGAIYTNAVGRGDTGAAAMTFDLILIGLVRKGAAFVFGWLVSLAVVVTVTVLATSNNPPRPHTAPASTALAIRIAIGVVLVAAAIRQWRRMRRPKKPKKPPKWLIGKSIYLIVS